MKKDKAYHFIAGFIIALIFGLINPYIGISLAIIAGASKEIVWDLYLKKGTFEFMDFVVTIIGGMLGFYLLHL